MIFNEYHTADKATIHKCTNFQHYLKLLLSAASTHTIKQYPATNPQPTSSLTTWLRKAFLSRRMFWTVWRDNISAIYRDWLHSLGTRSAGKFLKVASTSFYPTGFTKVIFKFASFCFVFCTFCTCHFPGWLLLSWVILLALTLVKLLLSWVILNK